MGKPAASGRTVYVGIGLVFALLVGAYFVYQIRAIVLAFLLTGLSSSLFSAPVNHLARRGLPRVWRALAVIAALRRALWLFGVALAPAIEEQSRKLAETFPAFLELALALANQVQSFFGLGTPLGLFYAACPLRIP